MIFILQNIHATEKIVSVYDLFDDNIFLHNFERLQKKTWLLIKYIISFLLGV